ncbi:MAG: hypothetical protein ABW000_07770 [Actinoplanes sp.]
MRLIKLLLPLLVIPLAISGCSLLGGDATGTPGASVSVTPNSGSDWILNAEGSATPSATASVFPSRSALLPPVTFLPVETDCAYAQEWTVSPVLIPVTVVPAAGRLTVSWPRQYNSDYRITAVKQPVVSGRQPNYTWQSVAPAAGCTVTATITGLKKGVPYIVWLDAPNTGYDRDGTRHPYSGRSGVVYPL